MKKTEKYIMLVLVLILIGTIYITKTNNKQEETTPQIENTETTENTQTTESTQSSVVTGDVITLQNEAITIAKPGTYTLSGSSSETVTVDTEGEVTLVLSGVNIKSNEAAIYVKNADKVSVILDDNTANTLEDGSSRSDEKINGTLYSTSDLNIKGDGSLTVISNFEDAIVSKDDLVITSGNITVQSVDDGIRGNDTLTIKGGTLNIEAQKDGLRSNNVKTLGKGTVNIEGGNITITAGDDGIQAIQSILITGGTIDIITSTEGIEAPVVTIEAGEIDIYATDDGINASASEFITNGFSINIKGGTLKVSVAQGDTDALDSNGDINISGGHIELSGQSTVDYDGSATFTGGTLIINGTEVNTLPNQMMGGQGLQRPGGGRR